jgi:glutathione S-transferase
MPAVDTRAGADVRLYVILGSHSCRSAMLMLDHKSVPYRAVELPSGLHPVALRLAGFSANERAERTIDGRSPLMIGAAERLGGTVPALRVGERRVKGNREIARFLEEQHAEPPLFPADPDTRLRVEAAERWAGEALQMNARRLAFAGALGGHLDGDGDDGRLGPLLFRQTWMRRLSVQLFSRLFAAPAGTEQGLLEQAREHLDRIDTWIGEGLLGGGRPLVADFMVAPSVALLEYHHDLREEIRRRPTGALLDRLLPA